LTFAYFSSPIRKNSLWRGKLAHVHVPVLCGPIIEFLGQENFEVEQVSPTSWTPPNLKIERQKKKHTNKQTTAQPQ
jgi:hypothetical protein